MSTSTAGLVISTTGLPAVAGPVLVVASEALLRHRLASQLGRIGFRVATCGTADEASSVLEQVRPRALIVSSSVTGTDWTVLATLARPTPVVVICGADAWQRAKAHALGCECVDHPDEAVSLMAHMPRWTGMHDEGGMPPTVARAIR